MANKDRIKEKDSSMNRDGYNRGDYDAIKPAKWGYSECENKTELKQVNASLQLTTHRL